MRAADRPRRCPVSNPDNLWKSPLTPSMVVHILRGNPHQSWPFRPIYMLIVYLTFLVSFAHPGITALWCMLIKNAVDGKTLFHNFTCVPLSGTRFISVRHLYLTPGRGLAIMLWPLCKFTIPNCKGVDQSFWGIIGTVVKLNGNFSQPHMSGGMIENDHLSESGQNRNMLVIVKCFEREERKRRRRTERKRR